MRYHELRDVGQHNALYHYDLRVVVDALFVAHADGNPRAVGGALAELALSPPTALAQRSPAVHQVRVYQLHSSTSMTQI